MQPIPTPAGSGGAPAAREAVGGSASAATQADGGVSSDADANGGEPSKVGYARAPADGRTAAREIGALRAAGCARVVVEPAGRSRDARPVFEEVVGALRPGDELVVWKLSAIGRSLPHLLQVIERLRARGAGLRSLSEHIEVAAGDGSVVNLLAALALFERELVRQRARDPSTARARGRAGGRKPVPPAKVDAMKALWAQGTMTADEIACRLQVGRRTVFKYVKAGPGGQR